MLRYQNIRTWIVLSLVLGVTLVTMVAWQHGITKKMQLFTDSSNEQVCAYDVPVFKSTNHVILYYAPWCPHCTAFRPEFDSAGSQAGQAGLDVSFNTVNADSQSGNCLKASGITSFPTVKFENGGTSITYNGLRNAAGLVSWLMALLPVARDTPSH